MQRNGRIDMPLGKNFLTCPPWLLDRSLERPVGRLADTPSFKSVLSTLSFGVIVPALLPFLRILGIDRETTIGVRWYGIVFVAILSILLVAMPIWFWWFLPRNDLPYVPHWNLKHDSPGRWVLTGFGMGVVAGLCGAWCGYRCLSAAAQHFHSGYTTVVATVSKSERESGRMRSCNWRVSLTEDRTRENYSVCFDPMIGSWLAPKRPEVHDTVIVHIGENVIGSAIVSMERAGR
jgi:hypothetical protein